MGWNDAPFDQHTPIWLTVGLVLGLLDVDWWVALGVPLVVKATEGATGAGEWFTDAAHGPRNAVCDGSALAVGWFVAGVVRSA